MKVVIDIPDEVKKAFEEATKDDLNGCYYDANSVIGKAIKNGITIPEGAKMKGAEEPACDNDADCEHCDWATCPDMEAER